MLYIGYAKSLYAIHTVQGGAKMCNAINITLDHTSMETDIVRNSPSPECAELMDMRHIHMDVLHFAFQLFKYTCIGWDRALAHTFDASDLQYQVCSIH